MSKKSKNPSRRAAQLERNLEDARADLRKARLLLWLIAGIFIVYMVVFCVLWVKGALPFTQTQVLVVNISVMIVLAFLLFRFLGRANEAKRRVEAAENKLNSAKK